MSAGGFLAEISLSNVTSVIEDSLKVALCEIMREHIRVRNPIDATSASTDALKRNI